MQSGGPTILTVKEIAPCFMDDQCGAGNVCINNTCIINATCTSFDLAPTSAFPPATSEYTCSGNGSGYEVTAA